MRRLLTDFHGGDLSGRCRYPLRVEKVPQISQIYTVFLGDVFLVTQISQMTQIFLFIGLHGIYSEVFLMRRLITDFHGGDLSGRCRYPLRLEYVPQISQIYTDFYSSDDTEFIRRFPAETITHGFSRRRPIRSVQIPTESGQRDSTEIPLKICVYL